jgi:two-component system, NarL family, sensor histidine kinase DesK
MDALTGGAAVGNSVLRGLQQRWRSADAKRCEPVWPGVGHMSPTLLGEARAMQLQGVRRWRTFAGIFLIYIVYALPDLFDRSVPQIVVGLILMLAFIAIYLGPLPHGIFNADPAARRWVPWAMTGLTGLYLVIAGGGGVIFSTYLCVAYITLLPLRRGIALALALCAAVTFLPQYVDAWDASGQQWSIGVPALLVSIAMIGMRLNTSNVVELYRARAEVERLAADQERLRIARDLHDLLGHALTTVIVKADLAARLAPLDADRAAQEMREVAALARQGLSDVRTVVTGYREISLLGEIATAREVLRAAGIEARLPVSDEDVPAQYRELFAWVLREGITNAVRHSRAGHVRVALDGRSIEVVDDGHGPVSDPTGAPGAEGNGLRGLRERADAVGARVIAGNAPGGGWRLRAEVPTARLTGAVPAPATGSPARRT